MSDDQVRKIDILQVCDSDGPLRKKEIAEMIGFSPQTIGRHVEELKSQGLLKESSRFELGNPDIADNIVWGFQTTEAGREKMYEVKGERRVESPPWRPQI